MINVWKVQDMPDLKGKVSVVTGGNAGLGFQSALALAQAGCKVVIGCRSNEKGVLAKEKILKLVPDADIENSLLDLTDFTSVRHFADAVIERHDRLDILLNNAGVVNLSELQHTELGHEMHFATNHLGHFLLTGCLLRIIKTTPGARVVTVSSGGYKFGEIRFDDLDWKKRPYHRIKSYGDSKLANMLFFRQLHKMFKSNGIDAHSIAAHPGLTASERQQTQGVGGMVSKWLASPMEEGVQPLLMACCAQEYQSGDFIGPKFGIRGRPVKERLKDTALNQEVAGELWDYSCQATEMYYQFGDIG